MIVYGIKAFASTSLWESYANACKKQFVGFDMIPHTILNVRPTMPKSILTNRKRKNYET